MSINDAYAQHKTLKLMNKVAGMIKEKFEGYGFCLIIFKFHEPGTSNYISNAERPTMIQALRETADRLEKNQDYNRKENT